MEEEIISKFKDKALDVNNFLSAHKQKLSLNPNPSTYASIT